MNSREIRKIPGHRRQNSQRRFVDKMPGSGKTLIPGKGRGKQCPVFPCFRFRNSWSFLSASAPAARDLFKVNMIRHSNSYFIDEIDAVGRHRGTVLKMQRRKREHSKSNSGGKWTALNRTKKSSS